VSNIAIFLKFLNLVLSWYIIIIIIIIITDTLFNLHSRLYLLE
jgi:hypothetical protein